MLFEGNMIILLNLIRNECFYVLFSIITVYLNVQNGVYKTFSSIKLCNSEKVFDIKSFMFYGVLFCYCIQNQSITWMTKEPLSDTYKLVTKKY
jgi:hypothetical protein